MEKADDVTIQEYFFLVELVATILQLSYACLCNKALWKLFPCEGCPTLISLHRIALVTVKNYSDFEINFNIMNNKKKLQHDFFSSFIYSEGSYVYK
jgi:hypothetical protein